MLLLIRKELILRQFRRQTDDTEIGIITVGSKGRFGMRTSEHTRIEFHTNQHIKRLVLKSQQHRHLHRDIRVVIFAALDLIDITASALMHEGTCAEEQTHLDDPMKQHVSHACCETFRIQKQHAVQHVAQIADR